MSQLTVNDALARIAISKNVIKEYKTSESERTVYLDNGTEFQIYIKNPYQNHLGINIYVNDKSIGNMLVLRPGQSVWLERFMNEERKFLFETYEVENTNEMHYAINKNGRVKLQFYHEREEYYASYPTVYLNNSEPSYAYHVDLLDTCVNDCSTNVKSYSDSVITASCVNTLNYYDAKPISNLVKGATFSATSSENANTTRSASLKNQTIEPSSIETGRVEKGSHSDQKFTTCDIKFEYYPFSTENILVLPRSRKQNFAKETQRKYCTNCGKKASPKDKFCSNCGHKL